MKRNLMRALTHTAVVLFLSAACEAGPAQDALQYRSFVKDLGLLKLPEEIGVYRFRKLSVEPAPHEDYPQVRIRFRYSRRGGEIEGQFIGRRADDHVLHDLIGSALLGSPQELPARKVNGQIVFALQIDNEEDWGVSWYGAGGATAGFMVESEEAFPLELASIFLKHLPSQITEDDLKPYPTYKAWAKIEMSRRLHELETLDLKTLMPENTTDREASPEIGAKRLRVRSAMQIIHDLTKTESPEMAQLVMPFVLGRWIQENRDYTEELRSVITDLSSWWRKTEAFFDPGDAKHDPRRH